MSGGGNAKGYHREYALMIVRMYLFLFMEGSGPLKSMLNLTNKLKLTSQFVEIRFYFCTGLASSGNFFYIIIE